MCQLSQKIVRNDNKLIVCRLQNYPFLQVNSSEEHGLHAKQALWQQLGKDSVEEVEEYKYLECGLIGRQMVLTK